MRLSSSCLSLVLLFSAGCASIATRFGPYTVPYTGVRQDLSVLTGENLSWLGGVTCALDLPLSLALDTVLLPVDVGMWAFGAKRWYWEEAFPAAEPGGRFEIAGCSMPSPSGDGWRLLQKSEDLVMFFSIDKSEKNRSLVSLQYYRPGAEPTKAAFGDRTFANAQELQAFLESPDGQNVVPNATVLERVVSTEIVQDRPAVRLTLTSHKKSTPGDPASAIRRDAIFIREPETGCWIRLEVVVVRARETAVKLDSPEFPGLLRALEFRQ